MQSTRQSQPPLRHSEATAGSPALAEVPEDVPEPAGRAWHGTRSAARRHGEFLYGAEPRLGVNDGARILDRQASVSVNWIAGFLRVPEGTAPAESSTSPAPCHE